MIDLINYNFINRVLLERQNKIVVPPSNAALPANNLAMVASMMRNFEDLGFTFSPELVEGLKTQDAQTLEILYGLMLPVLKEKVGAQVEHHPFYVNFPQQLMEMMDVELYLNAILHYLTLGAWTPGYEKRVRFPLVDGAPQVRVIQKGRLEDFYAIYSGMMAAKGSLSETDKKALTLFIQSCDTQTLLKLLPEKIPAKETLAVVGAGVLTCHREAADQMAGYFKTATDVLRLAVALSGGDVSLAAVCKFRTFKRPERRLLLGLLEQCGSLEEDMLRYAGRWIRLGEKLHPGEFSAKYPVSYEAFRKIRNGLKISTFGGRVNEALALGDLTKALRLLKGRAGELARKLDYLLRSYPGRCVEILAAFNEVAPEVSSQVLLQVMTHFKVRNYGSEFRAFFPKGNLSKVKVIQNILPPLAETVRVDVVQSCEMALRGQFAKKPALGKVYIDPVLKDMVAPLAQRSASKGLKTFARGSRFSLGKQAHTVRAFIHWKNVSKSELTDMDLSVILLDGNWVGQEQISYTNIRSTRYAGLYHSGDVRNAPEGASEFIDMDVNELKRAGIRYAVFNVYSFSRQNFNKVPECFFGWMEREKPDSGEIFEPKTVVNKSDLASESTISLPVIFDLETQQFYWVDVALKSNPNWFNNVQGNANNVVLMARALVEMSKPNLYDVFRLNAEVRGELVDHPEQADVKLGLDESWDVTPFDVEKILTEYL
jgi:hypothetical protein